jgi:hypothetical protein
MGLSMMLIRAPAGGFPVPAAPRGLLEFNKT